jgi:hypothetical protein
MSRPRLALLLAGAVAFQAVAVAALLVTISALSAIPVPREFDLQGVAVSDAEISCSGISTVAGTAVSFHWWAASTVLFGAWSCTESRLVYEASGTSGAASFLSQGGTYEFGSYCGEGSCVSANVSGSYVGPLLTL